MKFSHLDGPVGGDGTNAEDGCDEDDVGDRVEEDCAQDSRVTDDVAHSEEKYGAG